MLSHITNAQKYMNRWELQKNQSKYAIDFRQV